MSSDRQQARMRERYWVTKFDHTVDPPQVFEEIFIEDGRVVSVTKPVKTDAPPASR